MSVLSILKACGTVSNQRARGMRDDRPSGRHIHRGVGLLDDGRSIHPMAGANGVAIPDGRIHNTMAPLHRPAAAGAACCGASGKGGHGLGEGADDLEPQALEQHLWRMHPSHAYAQGRQRDWTFTQRLDFAQLLGPVEPAQHLQRWWQPSGETALWSEEGTHWQGGLAVLLEQWLSSGHGLAFPESLASAQRDRSEVAPTGLLLSPERLRHLADEIESRLAPRGTWRRRLCDWAIAHPQSGLRRLLKNRVRKLLGFQRLASIWQPLKSTAEPVWLAELKRDIA